MPKPPSPAERRRLVEDVQYLNLEEMRRFCQQHDLPTKILIERADGSLVQSKDRDRKDLVLARITAWALDGVRKSPTVYRQNVVATAPLPANPDGRTRIRYGQYEKNNSAFEAELLERTGGRFRFGMIARLVLRDFWISGRVPTIQQFAVAWLKADDAHTKPRPEGAYLVDLARGTAGDNWKARRVEIATRTLDALERLITNRDG